MREKPEPSFHSHFRTNPDIRITVYYGDSRRPSSRRLIFCKHASVPAANVLRSET